MQSAPSLHEIHHRLLCNLAPVDTDALTEIKDMRRRVKPDLVARTRKHGGESMGCRTLAVGSRYMYCRVAAVRVAENVVQSD